jgi:hypothetical protein
MTDSPGQSPCVAAGCARYAQGAISRHPDIPTSRHPDTPTPRHPDTRSQQTHRAETLHEDAP